MKRMHLRAALLTIACVFVDSARAGAGPDAEGWNGPGWYVAGSAPLTLKPLTTPAYILFNGPHASRSDCAVVYDRFYSPIGACLFLDTKPGT
jgi:hypothetical protein